MNKDRNKCQIMCEQNKIERISCKEEKIEKKERKIDRHYKRIAHVNCNARRENIVWKMDSSTCLWILPIFESLNVSAPLLIQKIIKVSGKKKRKKKILSENIAFSVEKHKEEKKNYNATRGGVSGKLNLS